MPTGADGNDPLRAPSPLSPCVFGRLPCAVGEFGPSRNLNDVIPYRFVTRKPTITTSKPVRSEPSIVVIVRCIPTIDC